MANLSNTKLNIIVATCNSRGIGIRGTLPWRIRYFTYHAAYWRCLTGCYAYKPLKCLIIARGGEGKGSVAQLLLLALVKVSLNPRTN